MIGKTELKQYFGYDEYKRGQEEVITKITEGHDVLCVMPTSAGKSMCYQMPALLMEGITIVISPLISLMKDQVRHLIGSGVKAAYINGSLTAGQIRTAMSRAREGWYKIIYVAPERLLSASFLSFARNADISMVTVDEAHCVSQWGHDFRSSYLDIAEFVRQLPGRPVLSAFTATATGAVRSDIMKQLGLDDPFEIVTGFDRENLYFEVKQPNDKMRYLIGLMGEYKHGSSIVYCATRKNVEQVCEKLREEGFAATRYHAGLSSEERHRNQESFVYGRDKIIVATNAFGMGIDKPDVRAVVHYNMPMNIEGYYQEAGRAGRDGLPSACILLYSPGDVMTNKFLINNGNEEENDPVRIEQNMKLLYRMEGYCRTQSCLRGYILNYFGEDYYSGREQKSCENCINCNTNFVETDITEDANAVFDCLHSLDARNFHHLGKTIIIQILRGSEAKKIIEWRLDKLPRYGELSSRSQKQVETVVDALIQQEYLEVEKGDYPTISLTEKAEGAGKITMHVAEVIKRKKAEGSAGGSGGSRRQGIELDEDFDSGLMERLKAKRMEIAREQKVPAYVVFPDTTLRDMCLKTPQTLLEFSELTGVGKTKLEKYGERFLEVLKDS